MRSAFVVAVVLVAAAGSCSAQPQPCLDPYHCQWKDHDDAGLVWEFDFSQLCNNDQDYSATDAGNHTYYFNLCGTTHEANRCLPVWRTNEFQYGAAVQFFGDPPPCNKTAPECIDPIEGKAACCTADCQVLGVGIPIFEPMEPKNPLFGGVYITHMGVPPSSADPFPCPPISGTGIPNDRMVTYAMQCDPHLQENEAVVLSAMENGTNPCHYIITVNARAACGCSPDCTWKNCGSDGCTGSCGGLGGECPPDYSCGSNQVCCKPVCDYLQRQCGSDGCGGTCGICAPGLVCNREGRCAEIEQNTPSATPQPEVYQRTVTKTGGSKIAGAFFGGILGTMAVAGGVWFYRRHSSGQQYGYSSA